MSTIIFAEFLKKFNHKIEKQNRKILLIMDNCSAHPKLNLSNIEILFLPPNTTS
jgi:transposase